MNRESMDFDTAMLFKFPNKQLISLWMYNVQFDIEAAFLDDNFQILEIKTLKAYPHIKDKNFFFKSAVHSNHFVQYVLEAKKGFYEAHQLSVGDVIPQYILQEQK